MISGTVSEVSGGNFATGAVTGAMGYLFNELGKEIRSRVELRHNRIVPGLGPLSPKHAYVLVTDMTNDQIMVYRAGPRMEGRHFGDIAAVSAFYVPGAPDWTTNPAHSQIIYEGSMSASEINSNFQAFTDAVNQDRSPYLLLQRNSNSFAYSLSEQMSGSRPGRVGFSPASQGGGICFALSFDE